MLTDAARRHGIPFVFCNLVGGNDELVFDGASFVVDAAGRVITRLARFEEDFAMVDPLPIGQWPAGEVEDDVAIVSANPTTSAGFRVPSVSASSIEKPKYMNFERVVSRSNTGPRTLF